MLTDKQSKYLTDHNDDLENYFRNTIIPQLFVDADLILRKFTPPAMKQFKLSPTDIGKHMSAVVDNFRFPSIIENIQHVIDSNQILEKEIQTTDKRWYQMNILPYVVQRINKTNGVIITFVDITSRIQDLKELEKVIADLEILLDTLSHDIKNPLTSMVLAVDQLKTIDNTDQPEFQTYVGIADRASTRIKTLIDELTGNRKNEHTYQTQAELLNFEHILEDVRLALSEDVKSSGARIKYDIRASEIFFSRRSLRTIMYNLLSNSIKYKSPPPKIPEICIKTMRHEGYLVISIQDNGIGIDAGNHDKIFTKYYRVNNAVEGSGIGLYLINEIVTKSGGNISVQSELNRGTEIKVFLKDEYNAPPLAQK
ncbi:MAG TPA: ATP-binding protein [Chitinophagaceae bacterium]|nr:ATP-binding protein [Chitinophagaceae bacterium]